MSCGRLKKRACVLLPFIRYVHGAFVLRSAAAVSSRGRKEPYMPSGLGLRIYLGSIPQPVFNALRSSHQPSMIPAPRTHPISTTPFFVSPTPPSPTDPRITFPPPSTNSNPSRRSPSVSPTTISLRLRPHPSDGSYLFQLFVPYADRADASEGLGLVLGVLSPKPAPNCTHAFGLNGDTVWSGDLTCLSHSGIVCGVRLGEVSRRHETSG